MGSVIAAGVFGVVGEDSGVGAVSVVTVIGEVSMTE
jgi:hypothetical protein